MWSQKGREGITNQSVVREKLLDFFNETNMTKYKFAKCSGLSTSTIYDIVQKEDYDVRESNIMKICKGMDVTPFELFQTDKKVLVINDPKEINVILEMRYLPEECILFCKDEPAVTIHTYVGDCHRNAVLSYVAAVVLAFS